MPDDARVSWSGSLGTDLGESLGQFDAAVKQGRVNLQNLKRQLSELEKAEKAVFGKHVSAVGADEMRLRIIDQNKRIIRQEQELAVMQRRKVDAGKRQAREMASDQNRASLWMLNARMRGEEAMAAERERGALARREGAEFEGQFRQFRHLRHRLHVFQKVGRLAMGADIALGGRDLGAIAWGMESLGQYFQETPGAGKIGKTLAAMAPWLVRAAGPLMFAYFGGELAKAALEWVYHPKADTAAFKAGGEAAGAVGQLAKDPSATMDQFSDLLRQMRAAQGSKPELAKAIFSSVARQARDVSAGRRPISGGDISGAEARHRIVKGTYTAGRATRPEVEEGAWWRDFYRERKFAVMSALGYGGEMIDLAKEEIATEKSDQRDKRLKMQDESLKERMRDPEQRVKRFKSEMMFSAYDLDRTRARMLAPTI